MRRLAPWVALALGSAACAAPSGPVVVPEDELPLALTRQTETPEPPVETATYTIFFVRDGGLEPVERTLPLGESPPENVMRALLSGPTATEGRRGIVTEIPQGARLLSITVDSGRVGTLDLSTEFQAPAPKESIVLRLAQVVWTLADLPEISSVAFSIDGLAVAVVTDDGTVVERPVSPLDYASVRPPEPDSPTTPRATIAPSPEGEPGDEEEEPASDPDHT